MPNAAKLAKKQIYFDKLVDLCVNTPKALIVRVDYVASKQMQNIRMDLRGRAVVLMGKNTMIRKALQIGHEAHPDAGLDTLRSVMKGNLGFILQQIASSMTFEQHSTSLSLRHQQSKARSHLSTWISLLDPLAWILRRHLSSRH